MIAPKRMSGGRYIDLANLSVDDISLEDINTSLNYIYRFTGHHKDVPPLTVAQHTKLVMRLSSILFPDELDVKFDCLLHDMPEAYYGDIATPLKRLMKNDYRELANKIDDVIYTKLWIIDDPFTKEVEEKRKVCDLLSLDIERRVMWKDQKGKDLWPEEPKNKFNLKEKQELFNEARSQRFWDLEKMYMEFVENYG